MLARLEEIPGVEESRVDRSGRRFLLTLAADADERRIAEQARGELGSRARVLGRNAESDALASYRRGELWMRASETSALSREEARVLAGRFGEEAARALGLSQDKTKKLAEVIERELAAAFVRVHGGENALRDLSGELETMSERVFEASRALLTDEEMKALRAFSQVRMEEKEEEPPECGPPPRADP